jgi:ABC-type phosphate/phosphonate transport system permease subunit
MPLGYQTGWDPTYDRFDETEEENFLKTVSTLRTIYGGTIFGLVLAAILCFLFLPPNSFSVSLYTGIAVVVTWLGLSWVIKVFRAAPRHRRIHS